MTLLQIWYRNCHCETEFLCLLNCYGIWRRVEDVFNSYDDCSILLVNICNYSYIPMSQKT